MKKIAFLSVVYDGVQPYLPDFLNSLLNQTFKTFDLIIANDSCCDFRKIALRYPALKIHELKSNGTIAQIREQLLLYSLEHKYDILFFGDSDDYFQENRISKGVELLDNSDIVVNDLNLVKDKTVLESNYISKRYLDLQEISVNEILNKNICGLTNTAIRTNIIKNISFDKKLKIVDWFLFAVLLHRGAKAVFTNQTLTSYRQHETNILGLGNIYEGNILKLLRSKTFHYFVMNSLGRYPLYKNLNAVFQKTVDLISDNEDNLKKYLEKILLLKTDHPLWWEDIKSGEELKWQFN
ncbi:MAG: hypothetical protein ACD_79C00758G0002 [uncultured bacterium]|nr:MAG: hypothetical protein ACD_79C00758G0002 [uncultured bacterium]